MYNIKKKKIWTNKFSDNELVEIWEAFSLVTPYLNKPEIDSGKHLDKTIRVVGFFVHPETDYSNDTIGIEPKRIKNFLKKYKIKDLKDYLFLLNLMAPVYMDFGRNYIDEDNHFNWDQFFIDTCFNEEKEPEPIRHILKNLLQLINKDYDLDLLEENLWIVGLFTKEFLKKYESLEDFIEDKNAQWKKAFPRVPKSKILVSFVNPENFSFDYIKYINHLYNTDLMKLSYIEQYKVSIAIMSRPVNIINVSPKYINYFQERYTTEKFPVIEDKYVKILSKKILDNIAYNDLAKLFDIAGNKSNDIIEKFNKLATSNNFTSISTLIQLYLIAFESTTKVNLEFLFSLPDYVVFSLVGQHSSNGFINLLQRYRNLWELRSKDKVYKDLSFSDGKYKISLMGPNDFESLILGVVTDCCQVMNGNGESCMKAGLIYESQGFVKVVKNKKIYGQSWYWTAETRNGEKVFCFDSIEILSKNLDQGKVILDKYIELSKLLVKEGFADIVIAGNDGNAIPEELNDFEVTQDYSLRSGNLIFPDEFKNNVHNVYTDTVELGQVILYKKGN